MPSYGYPSLPLSASSTLSLSSSVSPLHPANTSHSFYPGFPPVAYGATSALWYPCQLLLPTTSTADQFVPVCSYRAPHFCVSEQETGGKEKRKKHSFFLHSTKHSLLQIAPVFTNESLEVRTLQSLSSDTITASMASKSWAKALP